jgi:hypothetical protein
MGPKLCKTEKPKKEDKEVIKDLKRTKTIQDTMKKLFPHGKHFYNKELG